MLTADIALEDAILDLVDNSIDALSRARNIDLSADLLFSSPNGAKPSAKISISISEREIKVEDNCGGISKREIVDNVFRIGRVIPSPHASIGVYGIGMKRAIFKIGNSFEMSSRTTKAGFIAYLRDIDQWADSDDADWKIPAKDERPAKSAATAGTNIRIGDLRDPVKRRIKEGTLLTSLKASISRTYPLFLDRFVGITLNGISVSPAPLPFAESEQIAPAIEKFTISDPEVQVTLLAGVASMDGDEWTGANAGWYVICNGRVVLAADKSELTGWGTKVLPQFHSKYRAFIGIAFFFSEEPAALPWTTTKRGINRDSLVFQKSQASMATVTRQVLSFLNKLYPSDLIEAPAERAAAAGVKPKDVREVASRGTSSFKAEIKQKKAGDGSARVQFDVTPRELARARKCVGDPGWSAGKVGKHAFDYFLRNECGNG